MLTPRRSFLQAGSLAGLALAATRTAVAAPKILKPPRLRPGDTVGIVAPATATFNRVDVDIVQDTIAALGLRPRLGRHVLDRHGYLAGSDEQRAADINAMFADDGVRAVFAMRGGWGSSRVLPYLDYRTIAAHPKILLGYSDITALLDGVHARTGLVTFHGPVAISRWNTFDVDSARRILFDGDTLAYQNVRDKPEDELTQREYRIRTVTAGSARGRLIGGNLSVFTAIVGSPFLPDVAGAILFLEDTHEEPYRIDRMLTQLKLAGILEKLRAVVFGHCTDCEPGEGSYGSLTLEEILEDHVKPLGIPCWHGAMIGHIEKQFTLPIGIEAEVDATAGTIGLLEPAVS